MLGWGVSEGFSSLSGSLIVDDSRLLGGLDSRQGFSHREVQLCLLSALLGTDDAPLMLGSGAGAVPEVTGLLLCHQLLGCSQKSIIAELQKALELVLQIRRF